MSTNDITKFAAQKDATFGFAGKHGYSAELIAASSEKAATIGSQIVASMNVAKNTALYAGATAIGLGAIGAIDPTAVGLAAVAGAVTSFVRK